MKRCILTLIWMLAAAAGLAAEPGAKALKLFETLVKRPAPGFLFEQFYAAWLESATPEELKLFLEEKGKSSAESRQILGILLARSGDLNGAIELYRSLTSEGSQKPEVYLQLADLESRGRQHDSAVATLEAGLKTTPPPSAELAGKLRQLQGRVLAKAGRAEEAVKVWQALIKEQPKDEDLREDFIDLELQLGRREDAQRLARELVEQTKDPYKKVLRRLKLVTILQQDRQDAAVLETCEQCLEEVGGDSWLEKEVLNQIDQSFRERDQVDGLLKYWETLTAAFPQRLGIRQRQAQALRDAGRVEEALDVWRELLKLAPGDVRLQEQFVMMLGGAGKLTEAADYWKELIRLHPDNVDWRLKLAETLSAAGRKEEAIKAVQDFVQTSGGVEAAISRAAAALDKFKATDAALTLLKNACAQFPQNESLAQQYASALHGTGQKDAAMALWKQQASAAGVDAAKLMATARLAASRGETGFALELLLAKEADFSKDSLFQALLYDLAQRAEKWDIALKAGRQLLELSTDAVVFDTTLTNVLRSVEKGNQLARLRTELEGMRSSPESMSIASQCLLAALLERSNEVAAAESLFNSIAAKDSTLALTMLVRLQVSQQRFGDAAWTQARLVAGPGGRKAVHLQKLVELLEKAGKTSQALQAIADWKPLAVASPYPWLKEAELQQSIGKPQEALRVLRAASQALPENEDILLPLAKMVDDTSAGAESQQILLSLFEKATDLSSKMRLLSQLAESAARSGRLDYWIGEFEQRRLSNRNSPIPLLALAELQRRNSKPEARLQLLLSAARMQHGDKDLLMALAREAMDQGLESLATSTLLEAEAGDKAGEAKGTRALLLLQMGREKEASGLLVELASSLSADDAGWLAAALAQADFSRSSLAILRTLSAKDPMNYRIGYAMGRLLEECGEEEKALKEYLRILAIREEMEETPPRATRGVFSVSATDDHDPMRQAEFRYGIVTGNYPIFRARYDPGWQTISGAPLAGFDVPSSVATLAGRVLLRCTLICNRISPEAAETGKLRLKSSPSPFVLFFGQLGPFGFTFHWDELRALYEQHPEARPWLAPVILSSTAPFYIQNEAAPFYVSGAKNPSAPCPADLYVRALQELLPQQPTQMLDQIFGNTGLPEETQSAARSVVVDYLTRVSPNSEIIAWMLSRSPWSKGMNEEQQTKVFQALSRWLGLVTDEAERQALTRILTDSPMARANVAAQLEMIDAAFSRTNGSWVHSDSTKPLSVIEAFMFPRYAAAIFAGRGSQNPWITAKTPLVQNWFIYYQALSGSNAAFSPLTWPPVYFVSGLSARVDSYCRNSDWKGSKVDRDAIRAALPGLKSPVLKLILADVLQDDATIQSIEAEIDAASPPDVSALLTAAAHAWREQRPDVCLARFQKARLATNDEVLREAIDHALMLAGMLLNDANLLPGAGTSSQDWIREAFLRHQDPLAGEPVKSQIAKTMRKLGLVKESLALARSELTPHAYAMPLSMVASSNTKSSISTVLTQLTNWTGTRSSSSRGSVVPARELVNQALREVKNEIEINPDHTLEKPQIEDANRVFAERLADPDITGWEARRLARAMHYMNLIEAAGAAYEKAEKLSPFDRRIVFEHAKFALSQNDRTTADRLLTPFPEWMAKGLIASQLMGRNRGARNNLPDYLQKVEQLMDLSREADRETLVQMMNSLSSVVSDLSSSWEVESFSLPSLVVDGHPEITPTTNSKQAPPQSVLDLNARRKKIYEAFLDQMIGISDKLEPSQATMFYDQWNQWKLRQGATQDDLVDKALAYLTRYEMRGDAFYSWNTQALPLASRMTNINPWQLVVDRLLQDPARWQPVLLQPLLDNEKTHSAAEEISRCLPLMSCQETEFFTLASELLKPNEGGVQLAPMHQRFHLIGGIALQRKFTAPLLEILRQSLASVREGAVVVSQPAMSFFMACVRNILRQEGREKALAALDEFLALLKKDVDRRFWTDQHSFIPVMDGRIQSLLSTLVETARQEQDPSSILLSVECNRRLAQLFPALKSSFRNWSGQLEIENVVRALEKLDAPGFLQFMRDAGFLEAVPKFLLYASRQQRASPMYVSLLEVLRQSKQVSEVSRLLEAEPKTFGVLLTRAALSSEKKGAQAGPMLAVLSDHLAELKVLSASEQQEFLPLRSLLLKPEVVKQPEHAAIVAWLNQIENPGQREDIELYLAAEDEWDELPCEPAYRYAWVRTLCGRSENLSSDLLVRIIRKELYFNELTAANAPISAGRTRQFVGASVEEVLSAVCNSLESASEEHLREVGLTLERLAHGPDQLPEGYFQAYRQYASALRQHWLVVNGKNSEKFDPALLVEQLGRFGEALSDFVLPSIIQRTSDYWNVARKSLNPAEDEVQRWLDEAHPDESHPQWAIARVRELWGDRLSRTGSASEGTRIAADSPLQQRFIASVSNAAYHPKVRFAWLAECLNNTSFSISPTAAMAGARLMMEAQTLPNFQQWGAGSLFLPALVPSLVAVVDENGEHPANWNETVSALLRELKKSSYNRSREIFLLAIATKDQALILELARKFPKSASLGLYRHLVNEGSHDAARYILTQSQSDLLASSFDSWGPEARFNARTPERLRAFLQTIEDPGQRYLAELLMASSRDVDSGAREALAARMLSLAQRFPVDIKLPLAEITKMLEFFQGTAASEKVLGPVKETLFSQISLAELLTAPRAALDSKPIRMRMSVLNRAAVEGNVASLEKALREIASTPLPEEGKPSLAQHLALQIISLYNGTWKSKQPRLVWSTPLFDPELFAFLKIPERKNAGVPEVLVDLWASVLSASTLNHELEALETQFIALPAPQRRELNALFAMEYRSRQASFQEVWLMDEKEHIEAMKRLYLGPFAIPGFGVESTRELLGVGDAYWKAFVELLPQLIQKDPQAGPCYNGLPLLEMGLMFLEKGDSERAALCYHSAKGKVDLNVSMAWKLAAINDKAQLATSLGLPAEAAAAILELNPTKVALEHEGIEGQTSRLRNLLNVADRALLSTLGEEAFTKEIAQRLKKQLNNPLAQLSGAFAMERLAMFHFHAGNAAQAKVELELAILKAAEVKASAPHWLGDEGLSLLISNHAVVRQALGETLDLVPLISPNSEWGMALNVELHGLGFDSLLQSSTFPTALAPLNPGTLGKRFSQIKDGKMTAAFFNKVSPTNADASFAMIYIASKGVDPIPLRVNTIHGARDDQGRPKEIPGFPSFDAAGFAVETLSPGHDDKPLASVLFEVDPKLMKDQGDAWTFNAAVFGLRVDVKELLKSLDKEALFQKAPAWWKGGKS